MFKRFLVYFLVFFFHVSKAQKYNFVNWTVEDGLIQSQASFICQDNYRQLWIGTEGGISRFDGKKFTGFTVQEGLVSNHTNALFCDKEGNIWVGTNYGISVYNGSVFKSIVSSENAANSISMMSQLNTGDVYAINNNSLLRIRGFQPKKINISGDSLERITTVYHSKNDDLIACIYKKGISIFRNNQWTILCSLDENQKTLFIRDICISSQNDTLLATNSGLFILRGQKLVLHPSSFTGLPEANMYCITEDSKQNLWFGTDNGLYKLEDNKVIHFDAKSGFTDNSVNHIYKDVENNLWFATNGDGIYKFRENTFTYYDESSGLPNTIVMGVTQDIEKTIYVAGYGGGLFKLNENDDLEPVIYNGQTVLNDTKINCLYADKESNIWIGTLSKGTFLYDKKKGLKKIEDVNNPDITLKGATVFLKDPAGNMLIGTNQGLFVRKKDESLLKLKVPNPLITALRQFDNEHVIVGTSKGIYLLDANYNSLPLSEKDFGNASVLCIAKKNNNVWIGTTDKGVLNWNYKNGKIITYTMADGLPSNFIYSIDVSDKYKAWIGTGFGISNLQLDDYGKVLAIKNYGRSDGLLGMECNHNCLLKAADSSLWFGTTKGLFHFNPYTSITEKNQPFVLLRSVKLFSADITDSTLFHSSARWFNVPQNLTLYSKQNHLTFELGAIYFTNPEDVLYKYKLEGIDKGFTTTSNPFIIYPALPPGKYSLKVIGITKSGAVSVNEINYSFEIRKAFYQTPLFQLIVILSLLAMGAFLAYMFTRNKQKRKQKAKETLEKIREEEFIKLRQRTAEDFHDEMGNSLTRISVLTDILKSKINGKEQEISNLVLQIKENTTSLYNGSKDIIWSLNSKNDGLYEIVEHVKDIGQELFQETEVDFNFSHTISPDNKLKLKLDYSRNLTMIFKEAYSNILKHSKATEVIIRIDLTLANSLEISIHDNGVGIAEKTSENGNGLNNMKNRASRMNGFMTVSSATTKGTEIHFILKDIFI